jgi:hypothetical protein
MLAPQRTVLDHDADDRLTDADCRHTGRLRGRRWISGRDRPSSAVMDAWSGFDEMLTWLELGDPAQARRAFLRALNAR